MTQGSTTCPLCGTQAEVSSRGNLRDHLTSARQAPCPASGRTFAVALRMLKNRRAGRHMKRNADGSWLA